MAKDRNSTWYVACVGINHQNDGVQYVPFVYEIEARDEQEAEYFAYQDNKCQTDGAFKNQDRALEAANVFYKRLKRKDPRAIG